MGFFDRNTIRLSDSPIDEEEERKERERFLSGSPTPAPDYNQRSGQNQDTYQSASDRSTVEAPPQEEKKDEPNWFQKAYKKVADFVTGRNPEEDDKLRDPLKPEQLGVEPKDIREKNQQSPEAYQKQLESEVISGTAVRKDKLILNMEVARANNQKRVFDINKEIESIDPEVLTRVQSAIQVADTMEGFMGQERTVRNSYSGIFGDKEKKAQFDKAQALLDERTKLEKDVDDYSRILTKASENPAYFQDVIVSASIPAVEQARRAEAEAKSRSLDVYNKALDPNEKPEGAWAFFKNGVEAATNAIMQQVGSAAEGAGNEGDIEWLENWGSEFNTKFQITARENPQWFQPSDDTDEYIAQKAGSVLPSLATVIGSVVLAVPTRGKTLQALPYLSGGQAAVQSYGQIYREAKDSGADDDTAQRAAQTAAVTSYVVNQWGDKVFARAGSGVAANVTEEAVDATFKAKVANLAMEAGKSTARTFLVQGATESADQLAQNMTRQFFDSNADLFMDVVESGVIGGFAGSAISAGAMPLNAMAVKRARNLDPELERDGKVLRDSGIVPDRTELRTDVIGEPLTVFRGGVADDSSRPLMQLGKSYTTNPLVPDDFALEAAARSGQDPLVTTHQLKPGSTVAYLPDTYDARLLKTDPQFEGVDAIVLESTNVPGGEGEVVVLNDDALVKVSERKGMTALEKQATQAAALTARQEERVRRMPETAPRRYLSNQDDVDVVEVANAGRDRAGNPKSAEFEFNSETGRSTIYVTKSTTDQSIGEQIGKYIDKKIPVEFRMSLKNEYATLAPDAASDLEAFSIAVGKILANPGIARDFPGIATLLKRNDLLTDVDTSGELPAGFKPKVSDNLSSEEKAIEAKTQEEAARNYGEFKAKYLQDNATFNPDGSIKYITLNTDEWRGYFAEYRGTNAGAVHNASSYLNKKLYAEMLDQMRGSGNNTIAFYAGGGGSGKGSAVNKHFQDLAYPIRVDGTFEDYQGNVEKAAAARAKGYEVEMIFVDRNPRDAFVNGVVARAMNSYSKGQIARTVNIDIALQANIDSRKATLRTIQEYPDIPVHVVNNNMPPGESELVLGKEQQVAFLQREEYNLTELRKEIYDSTIKQVGNGEGQIPPHIARGLLGETAVPNGRGELGRANGTGEPGSEADGSTGGDNAGARSETGTRTANRGTGSQNVRQRNAGLVAPEASQGDPETRKSRAYERVRSRLAEEYQDSVNYNTMNILDDADKAFEFFKADPKAAVRIARGMQKPPAGITDTAISIVAAEAARESGNVKLQADLERARSLRQTRRGQEIVAERGRFDENSPHYFIRQVLAARLEKLGGKASLFDRVASEAEGRKPSKKASVERIDKATATLKKELSKSNLKIQEAQDLITSLTC